MSSQRRKTSWERGPRGGVSLAVEGAIAFPIGVSSASDGLTIVRTRGELLYALTLVTTANDGFDTVAFGVCIVSENAFAVGITAIPTPFTDASWDGWMVHNMTAAFQPVAGDSVGELGSSANRIDIDSKAMRKFKATDVLVGVLETDGEVGAATITAKLNSRLLLKLP